ncbi:MAG: hypothetical protein ACR5LA_02410 [Wolbachia sp.]
MLRNLPVSVQDSGKSKSEFTTNGVIRVADTGIQQNLCIRSAEWQNKTTLPVYLILPLC